jgi:hypothetical protein
MRLTQTRLADTSNDPASLHITHKNHICEDLLITQIGSECTKLFRTKDHPTWCSHVILYKPIPTKFKPCPTVYYYSTTLRIREIHLHCTVQKSSATIGAAIYHLVHYPSIYQSYDKLGIRKKYTSNSKCATKDCTKASQKMAKVAPVLLNCDRYGWQVIDKIYSCHPPILH